MNSPLRLFNVSGQLRLHFRQNVKWFATELVKSGYLRKGNLETKIISAKMDGIFLHLIRKVRY